MKFGEFWFKVGLRVSYLLVLCRLTWLVIRNRVWEEG